MRVTAATKNETRMRIVDAARALFRSRGYDETTTRSIAQQAKIGFATLFNYFPTKEAIVASVVGTALEEAQRQFEGAVQREAASDAASRQAGVAFEEELFAFVACELRHLKPYRGCIGAVLETVLSPLANLKDDGNPGAALRSRHLEIVERLAVEQGVPEMPTVALQMYWTLYTGVLAHWANDKSPKQEDTLALLDESLGMFVGWLLNPPESWRC